MNFERKGSYGEKPEYLKLIDSTSGWQLFRHPKLALFMNALSELDKMGLLKEPGLHRVDLDDFRHFRLFKYITVSPSREEHGL